MPRDTLVTVRTALGASRARVLRPFAASLLVELTEAAQGHRVGERLEVARQRVAPVA